MTEAQVRKAFLRADLADLAVERHQLKAGYGKSDDRTRELRVRAQALRTQAYAMQVQLKAQAG